MGVQVPPPRAAFEDFFAATEPRLRPALVATLGGDRGRDATAEALAWAYENWERLQAIDAKVAYLYRVGVSRTRDRKHRNLSLEVHRADPEVEPGLREALWALTERQREAVVLVVGYGWHLEEVAGLHGTSASTVNAHVQRGLEHLRERLGAAHD
jgi:DNA-directed RNA polymerase specialized sigma24 family protein